MIEPIPSYVQKLADLRKLAQGALARDYLDELIDFYRNKVDIVESRSDGDITFDYCRPKASSALTSVPHPPPPKGSRSSPPPEPATHVIAYHRPSLQRIQEVLLGSDPQEYFRGGKGQRPPQS